MTAPSVVEVSGSAEGRFGPLSEVFARVVANLEGTGAALCVYENGRRVVDLTGGTYRSDSLQLLFSVTKAVTAVAVGTAVERGELDLDQPLADHWPSFRRSGVDRITLRTVLSHRSGLAGLTAPVTFAQLREGADIDLVSWQEPFWEPDTAHGYHAFTFGSLVDGTFRRILGRSVGEVVRERIASPLGLDLWIGTPASVHDRIMPVVFGEPRVTPVQADLNPLPDAAFDALFAEEDVFNSTALREASWPALSGVSDARSLARMMAATLGPVDGHRLLSAGVLADLTATRSRGIDRALGVPLHYGSGFQLPFPQLPMLGPASYGHEAAGGSVVVADPDLGLAMAFTTNSFRHLPGASIEALALLPSLRHCATASVASTDRSMTTTGEKNS